MYCEDCEKIVRRCPDCHLPVFRLAKGDFVCNGEPTYHVWMDLDGARFKLEGEFTKNEVKTHFGLTNPES